MKAGGVVRVEAHAGDLGVGGFFFGKFWGFGKGFLENLLNFVIFLLEVCTNRQLHTRALSLLGALLPVNLSHYNIEAANNRGYISNQAATAEFRCNGQIRERT